MATEEEVDWMVGGGVCWFCGDGTPEAGGSLEVPLRKLVGPGETIQSKVCVPRCVPCRSGHFRVGMYAALVGALGAGAVATVFGIFDPFQLPFWGKALLVLCGITPGVHLVGGTIGLPAGVRAGNHAVSYPGVLEMIRGGWFHDDPLLREADEAEKERRRALPPE